MGRLVTFRSQNYLLLEIATARWLRDRERESQMSPERDGHIAGEFKRLAQGNCCLQLIRATETTPCSKYEKVLIVSPPFPQGLSFCYSKIVIHACQQTPKFQQNSVNHNQKRIKKTTGTKSAQEHSSLAWKLSAPSVWGVFMFALCPGGDPSSKCVPLRMQRWASSGHQ